MGQIGATDQTKITGVIAYGFDGTNARPLKVDNTGQLTLSGTAAAANLASTGAITIKPSGDNDDYLSIATVANVPTISTVGTCDLKIAPSNTNLIVEFPDWQGYLIMRGPTSGTDMRFDLQSSDQGNHGSGILLSETDTARVKVNQWSIVRTATSGTISGRLLFAFGSNTDFDDDPPMMYLTANGPVIGRADTAIATNVITDNLQLQLSSGTAVVSSGFGFGMPVYLSNAAAELEERASIDVVLQVATNGAEQADIAFNAQGAGTSKQLMKLGGDGTIYMGNALDGTAQNILLQRQGSATAGTTLRNSQQVIFRGAYWNGAAATTHIVMQNVMAATTGWGELRISATSAAGSIIGFEDNAGTARIRLYAGVGQNGSTVVNNAVTDALTLEMGCGTAAATIGQGVGLVFKTSNTAAQLEERGSLDMQLATATDGAEVSDLAFKVATGTAGIKTVMKLSGDGNLYVGNALDGTEYALLMQRLKDATAGTTSQNSQIIKLRGAYWAGAASSTRHVTLQNVVTGTNPQYGLFITSDNAGTIAYFQDTAGSAKVALIGQVVVGRNDTNIPTDAIYPALTVRSGTFPDAATVGQGTGIQFEVSNDAAEIEERGDINLQLADATNGAEVTRFDFQVASGSAGVKSTMKIGGDGLIQMGSALDGTVQSLLMQRLANATAGTTLRNSQQLKFRSAHLAGTVSTEKHMILQNVVSSTAGVYTLDVSSDDIANLLQLQDNAGTARISVFGVTPAVRAGAYTQTYSTADKTHENMTTAAITATSGTADGTMEDVGGAFAQTTLNNNFQEAASRINTLVTDITDVKQLVNALIDDLQAYGWAQ